MTGWRSLWNRLNRIYVNERHLRVHYRRVADDLIGLAPGAGAVVLDYGCGEALEADRVAATVSRLLLYDAADATRERPLGRHGARSDAGRGGKECVRKFRSRRTACHYKKKEKTNR